MDPKDARVAAAGVLTGPGVAYMTYTIKTNPLTHGLDKWVYWRLLGI